MSKILLFLIPAFLFLTACGEDRTLEYADRIEANEWIYSVMDQEYFYKSSLSSPDRIWYALPANFFQSVRASAEARGGHYVSQLYFGTVPVTENYSYGYFSDYHTIDSLNYLHVIYVAPQSPAAEAGLERGDWIMEFDGKKIGSNNYTDLTDVNGGPHTLKVGKLVKEVESEEEDKWSVKEEKEVLIPAARELTASPVETYHVFTENDRKVGYLMYTRFESAPGGENATEGTYNQDLRQAFAYFSSERVEEMVLDLRFSTGMAYSCAQLLGTMLAPSSALGQLFFMIVYNSELKYPFYLDTRVIGTGANLNLSTLYVIATSRTQGAAELLVQSLSPYMNVVVVGSRTSGYDLLTDDFTNDSYGMTLRLATRILVDSEEETYSSGISPKVSFSDTDSIKTTRYDFGDPKELMLKRTLQAMKDMLEEENTEDTEEPESE